MTIPITTCIRRTAFEGAADEFDKIVKSLEQKGYAPLISQAKERFLEPFLAGTDTESRQAFIKLSSRRVSELTVMDPFYRRRIHAREELPATSELYLSKSGDILYTALVLPQPPRSLRDTRATPVRVKTKQGHTKAYFEAGYIGQDANLHSFELFVALLTELLKGQGSAPDWKSRKWISPKFLRIAESKDKEFVSGSKLSPKDLEMASQFEDSANRSLALVVKTSGGILASDLAKKSGTKPDEVRKRIETLIGTGFVAREYVVICRKTSNQINRCESKEALEQLDKMGVRCSCGRPLSGERVEELFVPTSNLKQMLDQSYWMTARLVQALAKVNIREERVLLGIREGSEEVDAFVDLDGRLLMFELKDDEFSMGHAYPFGGRIGLYNPDVAAIVSTKGIDTEVKEYFKRIRPGAQIIYIDELKELPLKIQDLADLIRSENAMQVLAQFDPMASVSLRLSTLMARRIGIEPRVVESWEKYLQEYY